MSVTRIMGKIHVVWKLGLLFCEHVSVSIQFFKDSIYIFWLKFTILSKFY